MELLEAVDEAATRTGFSGVVRVDRAGTTEVATAYGLADRAHGIPHTLDTQLGIASGTKSLTALTVMALVERGTLTLATTARSLLGDDLPLVADDVTVGHLLAHRSGIGDYLDEDAIESVSDYVMPVPVHRLATTEQYLAVLDGHATVSPAGERFAYNNGGYVLHLPVVGSGDGGLYSTAADLSAFWDALFAGRIVAPGLVAEMVRPHSDWPEEQERYGLGFHLHATGDAVWLEGADAGVSFVSLHQPSTALTWTVLSNWSSGAWPITSLLDARLGT